MRRRNGGMSEIIAAFGSSASRNLRTLLSISPEVALIAANATAPILRHRPDKAAGAAEIERQHRLARQPALP